MSERRRTVGFTLIELLTVFLIIAAASGALVSFIRVTYSAQDTIMGSTTSQGGARLALDALADSIRNAQWYNPAGLRVGPGPALQEATSTAITLLTSSTDSTQNVRYALVGTNLTKSVNGAAATTVIGGVTAFSLTYYRASDWAVISSPVSSDYPLIGGVDISATVAVTQMSTYSNRYSTYVRLRNSPAPNW